LTVITCDIFVCVVGVWLLPNTDYAHKNITSNYSQARATLPEDGSQRIRNVAEFLIVF